MNSKSCTNQINSDFDNNNNESSYYLNGISFEDSQVDHFIPYCSPSILFWQKNRLDLKNDLSKSVNTSKTNSDANLTDIERMRGENNLSNSNLVQIHADHTLNFTEILAEKIKKQINNQSINSFEEEESDMKDLTIISAKSSHNSSKIEDQSNSSKLKDSLFDISSKSLNTTNYSKDTGNQLTKVTITSDFQRTKPFSFNSTDEKSSNLSLENSKKLQSLILNQINTPSGNVLGFSNLKLKYNLLNSIENSYENLVKTQIKSNEEQQLTDTALSRENEAIVSPINFHLLSPASFATAAASSTLASSFNTSKNSLEDSIQMTRATKLSLSKLSSGSSDESHNLNQSKFFDSDSNEKNPTKQVHFGVNENLEEKSFSNLKRDSNEGILANFNSDKLIDELSCSSVSSSKSSNADIAETSSFKEKKQTTQCLSKEEKLFRKLIKKIEENKICVSSDNEDENEDEYLEFDEDYLKLVDKNLKKIMQKTIEQKKAKYSFRESKNISNPIVTDVPTKEKKSDKCITEKETVSENKSEHFNEKLKNKNYDFHNSNKYQNEKFDSLKDLIENPVKTLVNKTLNTLEMHKTKSDSCFSAQYSSSNKENQEKHASEVSTQTSFNENLTDFSKRDSFINLIKNDLQKRKNKEKIQEIIITQKQQHEKRMKELERLSILERQQADKLKQILLDSHNETLLQDSYFNANQNNLSIEDEDSELNLLQKKSNCMNQNQKSQSQTARTIYSRYSMSNVNLKEHNQMQQENRRKSEFTGNHIVFKQNDFMENSIDSIDSTNYKSLNLLTNKNKSQKSLVEVIHLKNMNIHEKPKSVLVIKENSPIQNNNRKVYDETNNQKDARPFFSLISSKEKNENLKRRDSLLKRVKSKSPYSQNSVQKHTENLEVRSRIPTSWFHPITPNESNKLSRQSVHFHSEKNLPLEHFFNSNTITSMKSSNLKRSNSNLTNDNNVSALKAMNLQEAFETFKRDLINRSKKRQNEILAKAQQRNQEAELRRQYNQLVSNSNSRNHQALSNRFHVKQNKHEEEGTQRRRMSIQEIKFQNKKIYEKLPEVKQKQFKQKIEEEKVLNRMKSSIFKKSIQQHILTNGQVNFAPTFKAIEDLI